MRMKKELTIVVVLVLLAIILITLKIFNHCNYEKIIEPNDPNWYEYIEPNDVYLYDENDPNLVSGMFFEPNDAKFDFIPNIVITCKSGKEVVIDYSGDEVKVTGACEEGAKIFFEEKLKPYMDAYIKAKMSEDVEIKLRKIWTNEDWLSGSGIIGIGYKSVYSLTTGSYDIALGYKAGWDWTDENYQFAFTLPNEDGTWTEYSCEMNCDEYKNVYNVVQRALKNKRIIK